MLRHGEASADGDRRAGGRSGIPRRRRRCPWPCGRHLLRDRADLGTPICDFPSKEEANAAIQGVQTDVSVQHCLRSADGSTLTGDEARPVSRTSKRRAMLSPRRPSERSRSATAWCPRPTRTWAATCRGARRVAPPGDGQERLLQVIGTTARLEEREVLGRPGPDRRDVRRHARHVRHGGRARLGGVLVLGPARSGRRVLGGGRRDEVPAGAGADLGRRDPASDGDLRPGRSDRRRAGMADRLRAHG